MKAIVMSEMVVAFGDTEEDAFAAARRAGVLGVSGKPLSDGEVVECSVYCAAQGDGHPSVLWRDAAGILRHRDERADCERVDEPSIIFGGRVAVAALSDEQVTRAMAHIEAGLADEDRAQAEREDAGEGDARAFLARVARLHEDRTGALLVVP